jgi:calcineurin-like phosphoesterase family protein
MNNIFFIADTHFGHSNIIKHCNRPWSTVEEHDETLIQNWNNTVKRGDLVYHLGDFAMIKENPNGIPRMKLYRKLRMRLNGKIIIAGLGNHDKMSQEIYNECFTEVHQILERKINGYSFTMCHYPLLSWNRSHHNYKYSNNLKFCSIMLHGHCHNRLKPDNPYRIDVGIDGWDYHPFSFDQLLTSIQKGI